MKKILFILLISAEFSSSVNAQTTNPNITPISIECWGLQQNSFNLSPNIYKHYSCFELPESGTVNITGTREVDLTAGKQVHLKPGFSVNSLTGNGNFHAAVEKEEVGVAVFAPSGTFGEVPKCEKLELGLNLPSDIDEQIDNYFNNIPHNINPFDPDQISVEAIFTHYDLEALNYYEQYILPTNVQATGTVRKSFGFYYEEFHEEMNDPAYQLGYWVQDTTSFTFRIRFSPNKTGIWRTEIVIKTDNQVLYILKPIYFKCTPNSSPGFIVGGETTSDGRHFVFENGDAFFGMGQNIPLADYKPLDLPVPGVPNTRVQPVSGYILRNSYINDLANNHGNLVRLMFGEWVDAIEFEHLGNYKESMPFAWEFDRTMDLCKQRNMYIIMLQQQHTMFMEHNPYGDDNLSWIGNPYHTQLGLNNIEDFFTDTEALRYYKMKTRYIMSRWGYSSQIAAIQPMSEMNEMGADPILKTHRYAPDQAFRQNVNDWFVQIKNYVQLDLGYNFNIGSSFTADMNNYSDPNGNSILGDADFNDFHPYSDQRNANLATRWGGMNDVTGYGIIAKNNKPGILAEMGANARAQLYVCGESDFHNDLWATSMMGGWAGGLHWNDWADKYNNGFRQNFNFMRTFFDTYIDFKNIEWEPERWPGNNIGTFNDTIGSPTYDKKYDNYFEAFYMTGDPDLVRDKRAFGWVHNRSSYWYNRLLPCENAIIQNNNSNTDTGDDIPGPTDDDLGGFVFQNGNSNKKNRKIRIDNMSNFQNFEIRWFNPYTGAEYSSTHENHGIGAFTITIPDEINFTQFQDLVFLMYPNNSSFYTNGFSKNEAEIFIIESENEIKKETNEKVDVLVYPNPSNGIINVDCSEKIIRIEVINVVGDLLESKAIESSIGEVDISKFAKGVYIFKIVCDTTTTIKKIIYQ